jgi:hypothetical protein
LENENAALEKGEALRLGKSFHLGGNAEKVQAFR